MQRIVGAGAALARLATVAAPRWVGGPRRWAEPSRVVRGVYPKVKS
jgi:hypothetical protein